MFNLTQSRQTNNRGMWLLSFLIMLLAPQMTYANSAPVVHATNSAIASHLHMTALSGSAPDLYVTSTSGAAGASVSVSVMADFSVAVNSMQFTVSYDSTLLTLSSATVGSAVSSWSDVNNPTAGQVTMGMYNTGGTGSEASGSAQQVAVINFTVNSSPSSDTCTDGSGVCSDLTPTPNSVTFDSTTITTLTAGTFTLIVPETLTINTTGNGTVTCGNSSTPCASSVSTDTSVEFFANPSSGYALSSWLVSGSTAGSDCAGTTGTCTITITAPTSVTANFTALVAPSITAQPSNQTVTAPATATFTVAATGAPTPTYQWQDSTNSGSTWTTISGATSASYVTPATTTANSGTEYECVVSNSQGNVTSSAATLTVNPTPVIPTITVQPSNQTVTAPATATFTVTATGTPTPTYQWQDSTNSGSTWTTIGGATSASYVTPATTTANSGTEYECVVSNSQGNVTSSAATLTVNPTPVAPTITVQPSNQTVTAPATATFTVTATGTPTPTYQWQDSTNSGSTWTTIGGATSASYVTPATSTANSGTEYECVVSNSQGNVTSSAATLTVNPTPVTPSITSQPSNETVTAPATATFTVTATGTPTPTYQWEDSTNSGSSWTAIGGATSASYVTPATTTANSGTEYKCVATNTAGSATSNAATLTVNPTPVVPTITLQPSNQTVVAPATATFTVTATGTPTPTYQWQDSTNSGSTWTTISGATSASYVTPATTTENSGTEYECVVSNSQGNVTSSAATLTVSPTPVPPVVTSQPSNETVTAPATATFTLTATGTPTPTYQWEDSTNNGSSWTAIGGATSASYVTAATTVSNSGTEYKCVVTNSDGTATSNAVTLTVDATPVITAQPNNETVTAPATATFTVTATGTPTPTYQWQSSTNSGGSWTSIGGATSASYVTPATTLSNSGTEYECVLTNTAGTVTSNAVTLTVNVTPSVTTQPISQTVTAPATATFTVVATGTPTPTYQWEDSTNSGSSWTAISGATSASYVTAATTVSNSGTEYKCVVTNSAGIATSNPATLTVDAVPAVTTQPSNQTVIAPATATFTVAASGNPAPTYQWQVSTNSGSTWTAIGGATSVSYVTPATTLSNSGNEYECVVTNTAGAVTSNPATLTVNVVPAITAQPNNQTVTAPATATFTVTATGTPTPSYQWQVSTNGGTSFTNIGGATSASYTTPATTGTNNGSQFKCVVTNAAGTVTSSAVTLTVDYAPSITTQPGNKTVVETTQATFTVIASGNPLPTYQWQESTDSGSTWTPIGGATSASYVTPATTLSNSGAQFECVVTNGIGSVTSNAATMTVVIGPVNGGCGTANTKAYAYGTTGFGSDTICSVGNSSPATFGFPAAGIPVNWVCLGANGGANASCTATQKTNVPFRF